MESLSRIARRLAFAIAAALSCGCRAEGEGLIPKLLATATPVPCPGTVVRVTYEDYSGPVADRYTEYYTITLDGVTFERTGEEGGPINRGSWTVEASPGSIEALFEELGAVDCRQIKEVQPEEVPIGGGSRLYKIEYEGGGRFGMWYHEGVTYENGEAVTGPVRAFVRDLRLPDEAWSTMRQSP